MERIHSVTGGDIFYSGPRTPVIGYVETLIREVPRKIEVLRDVKGLSHAELADAVDLVVDGLRLRVLAPVKVLKAKICNTVTLDLCQNVCGWSPVRQVRKWIGLVKRSRP